MKKLKAFWNLYRCTSFHLVTVNETSILVNGKFIKSVLIDNTMTQETFDEVMDGYAKCMAEIIVRKKYGTITKQP